MSVKLFQIEMVVSTAGERGGTHYGGPVPVSADSFGAVLRRLVEGYHGDNGVLIEKLVVKEVRGEEVDVQASKAGV